MPINITSNIEKPEIRVVYSSIAELISIINVLADKKHHAFLQEEVENLFNILSKQSMDFLKKVSELPFQGIEFFEILLDCKIFNDVDKFSKAIMQYDDKKFIKVFTGDELTDDKVEELTCDKQALIQFLDDFPWVYRGKSSVFESLLYETKAFKESLAVLIVEVNKLFFMDKEPELKSKYEEAVETINEKLSNISPIALGEEIMNKKIEMDKAIEEYIFLPSFYINPHFVMAYNSNSRMFLYDIRKEDSRGKNLEKELSTALKILSDETRLEILRLLILQPTYGKVLASRLNLTAATISHHLDLLSSANLINQSRDKNTKYFSANEEEIKKLITKLNNYLYNK